MGMTFNNAALLIRAKRRGVTFRKTLMVGRLRFFLSKHQLDQLAKAFDLKIDADSVLKSQYAEDFIRQVLGAEVVDSIDYSDYEGATLTHDLNLPVDQRLHQHYDVVIDGGTIQHVFNYPVALTNCLNMVKTGGQLFIFTLCNNQSGQAFYQFSPDLFFRVLEPANGFLLHHVLLEEYPFLSAELAPSRQCYQVTDALIARRPICLFSKRPITMMVEATRMSPVTPFLEYPIQSRYRMMYEGVSKPPQNPKAAPWGSRSWLLAALKGIVLKLPLPIKNRVMGYYELWQFSLWNRRFYRRWDPLKAPLDP